MVTDCHDSDHGTKAGVDPIENTLSTHSERHHRPCGKEEGQTNHVERFNLTLRRRLARLARKTLSFSKSERMHEFFVRWFLTDHNQVCLKRLEKNSA